MGTQSPAQEPWEPRAAPGLRAHGALRAGPALTLLLRWTGGELREDVPVALPERRDSSCSQPDPAWSPSAPAKSSQQQPRSAATAPPCEPPSHGPCPSTETLLEALVLPAAGGRPRTPHSITVTPPATPQPKRRHRLKPPRTPPPPCRKVFQLLPNFPTLTRSKSHESQLGNRIDEVPPGK